MTSRILTHNFYALTSLVMLTIGSFYICSELHKRSLSRLKFSLIDTNALIKLLMVIFGFCIVSWRPLLDARFQTQAFGIFMGIMSGYFFAEIETYLLRYTPAAKSTRLLPNRIKQNAVARILLPIKPIKRQHEFASYHSIAVVGACEEILYRGFLTVLCVELLNIYSCIFCLMICTFLFALSHLNLGYIHVLSKFILGLICLLSFLCIKTIMAPILIHVTFNTIAIYKYRKFAYA